MSGCIPMSEWAYRYMVNNSSVKNVVSFMVAFTERIMVSNIQMSHAFLG